MANEPEKFDSDASAHNRVNLGVFVGRIAGGFVGLCLGVTLGVRVGGSLAPVVGSMGGLFVGVVVSDFIFKAFPRLAPAQTMPAVAAGCGVSGLVIGLFIGDAVSTFAGLDRLYGDFIGASLGLYVGVLVGNARERV